ncbi:MAG TPA: tetratricopeptide repeat protein [Pyrinomonadaceae bacterium]|nr:tetratricopeptide repeat protein [Pyrinomonadaceae bacterium]
MKVRILIFTASITLFFLAIPQIAQAQKNGEAQMVILDENNRATLRFSNQNPDQQQCGFHVSNLLLDKEESLAIRVSRLTQIVDMPEIGWLYITASRIVYRIQTGDPAFAFAISRKDLDEKPGSVEDLTRYTDDTRTYFSPGLKLRLHDRPEQQFAFRTFTRDNKCSVKNQKPYKKFIKRAVNDFSGAMAEFKQLTTSLQHAGKFQFGPRRITSASQPGNDESAIPLPPPDPNFNRGRQGMYYAMLSVMESGNGRKQQAREHAEKALQLLDNPTEEAEFYAKGVAQYELGNDDLAIVNFDKAIQLDSQKAARYLSRGLAYYRKKDHDRAIADFDKAIQLESALTGAYVNRGEIYNARGEYDRAIADFDKAIEIEPQQASTYMKRGNAYFMKNNLDRTISNLDKAIQLNPNNAGFYGLRATVHAMKRDYLQAILDCDKALHLDPDDVQTYSVRANAYSDIGDYDRSIADFDKVVQLKPDDIKAYLGRGKAYFEKGNYDRSIADLQRAIELDPQSAEAYITRGIAYARKNDLDRAFVDFEKAIQLRPQYGFGYYNRGRVYHFKGDYDRAIADYSEAIRLKPEIRIYQSRASAYESKGDKDKAQADRDKAAELEKQQAKP